MWPGFGQVEMGVGLHCEKNMSGACGSKDTVYTLRAKHHGACDLRIR